MGEEPRQFALFIDPRELSESFAEFTVSQQSEILRFAQDDSARAPWKIVPHVPAGAGVSVEAVERAKN